MNFFRTKGHFVMCPCEDGLECTSDKQVHTHPQFGTLEHHTNPLCSKPEGSGEDASAP